MSAHAAAIITTYDALSLERDEFDPVDVWSQMEATAEALGIDIEEVRDVLRHRWGRMQG